MFFDTDTADAPWTVIRSDDEKRARLNGMLHVLSTLDHPDKTPRIARVPDPLIAGQAGHVIQRSDHILGAALHPDTRKTRGAGRARRPVSRCQSRSLMRGDALPSNPK